MKFDGYVFGPSSARTQLPKLDDPSPEEIIAALQNFVSSSGIACLREDVTPDVGAYELTLYADSGTYLLMLSRYTDDGDHEVDSITNPHAGDGEIEVLGDLYSKKMTTQDISVVLRCFCMFASCRTISPDLLDLS